MKEGFSFFNPRPYIAKYVTLIHCHSHPQRSHPLPLPFPSPALSYFMHFPPLSDPAANRAYHRRRGSEGVAARDSGVVAGGAADQDAASEISGCSLASPV